MATIIKKYKKLILVIAFFLIIIVEFRGIFFNINKAFIDWGDTSFIAWQISITRNKLLNLDFKNVYDTNSHYPYKNSLLFTDSFLGQSVFALPLFFIKNPVLLYNIIFFFTIFLNYWCSFLLFQKLLKSDTAGFIGSFFLNNSVYFFDQIIHLQTITYWPMILVLYYLFKLIDKTENFSFKNSFLIGFFLSVQFYMAVYLGIFSIFLVTLFLAWNLFYGLFIKEDKFRFIRAFVIQSIIMGIAFIVLTYPFLIRKYLEFQQVYHQVRDMNEIIANSGNITDYLFFLPQTFFSSLSFIAKYNSHVRFTSERISFPGFILFAGAILGFITRKKKGGIFNLILFFSLIGTGFVFSLGPRLMANGKYMVTPLPYLAFLKIFDFLFSIRLTHRWAIFLIIGLVYFATQYYSKLSKSLIIIVLFLFVLESIPIKIPPKHKEYLNKSYQYLKKAYLKDKVLLEYPLLSFERGVGVDDETMRLLASVYHKMKLFNGYTGLFISDYGTMRIYLEKFFPDPLTDGMIKALGIDYLKIDKNFVNKEQLEKMKLFYPSIVYEDNLSIIYKLPKNNDIAQTKDIKPDFAGDHAYGKDRKLYVNLTFNNTLDKYYANRKQEKVTLVLTFYKKDKIIRKKKIFNLYPLVIVPKQNRGVTFDLYEKPGFDKVTIDLFDLNNKFINSRSLIL